MLALVVVIVNMGALELRILWQVHSCDELSLCLSIDSQRFLETPDNIILWHIRLEGLQRVESLTETKHFFKLFVRSELCKVDRLLLCGEVHVEDQTPELGDDYYLVVNLEGIDEQRLLLLRILNDWILFWTLASCPLDIGRVKLKFDQPAYFVCLVSRKKYQGKPTQN